MQLKPCPFCGAKDVSIRSKKTHGLVVCYVYCSRCGATGPGAVSISPPKTAAAEMWNRMRVR